MNEAAASTHLEPRSADHSARPLLARYEGPIRIASILAIAIGLFLVMQTLPIGDGVRWLENWIGGLGVWGAIVFAAVYIVAAVAFIPGAALTVAAGALFGLFWGTLVASVASTTAAALAFLIGRYVARDAVQQQAQRYSKFRAVDRAIGEEGWKIVALLRLAPVFPFSIGNYLLGLTAVRFWSYVLASWIAMLPGTFLYVYFGYLGRAGVEAAGGVGGRSVLEWVMLILGVLAIFGLVIYIVRFALRALSAHTDIEPDTESDAKDETMTDSASPASRRNWRVALLPSAAIVMLVLGACAQLNPNWFGNLFGPPAVAMAEAYEPNPDGPTFDHSDFDRMLRQYVSDADGGGWIDYKAWKTNDRDALQAYIERIGEAEYDALGRDEKLALLINAYNAFTIELIFEYWDDGNLNSIRDIPSAKRWDDERWRIGANVWSLNQIEHQQIRPNFKEPRIHWAVVCAAIGCPPLRSEAYTGTAIDEQLDDQGQIVHTHERWLRYDRDERVIHLTQLYNWYTGDFEQVDGGVLEHAAQYVPQLKEDLDDGRQPRIRWLEYDWNLNHREHVR